MDDPLMFGDAVFDTEARTAEVTAVHATRVTPIILPRVCRTPTLRCARALTHWKTCFQSIPPIQAPETELIVGPIQEILEAVAHNSQFFFSQYQI